MSSSVNSEGKTDATFSHGGELIPPLLPFVNGKAAATSCIDETKTSCSMLEITHESIEIACWNEVVTYSKCLLGISRDCRKENEITLLARKWSSTCVRCWLLNKWGMYSLLLHTPGNCDTDSDKDSDEDNDVSSSPFLSLTVSLGEKDSSCNRDDTPISSSRPATAVTITDSATGYTAPTHNPKIVALAACRWNVLVGTTLVVLVLAVTVTVEFTLSLFFLLDFPVLAEVFALKKHFSSEKCHSHKG
jgi:hypothetical protein